MTMKVMQAGLTYNHLGKLIWKVLLQPLPALGWFGHVLTVLEEKGEAGTTSHICKFQRNRLSEIGCLFLSKNVKLLEINQHLTHGKQWTNSELRLQDIKLRSTKPSNCRPPTQCMAAEEGLTSHTHCQPPKSWLSNVCRPHRVSRDLQVLLWSAEPEINPATLTEHQHSSQFVFHRPPHQRWRTQRSRNGSHGAHKSLSLFSTTFLTTQQLSDKCAWPVEVEDQG